ncbi:MAG: S41 family peptidase, partial [Acidobacteriota bacterium]
SVVYVGSTLDGDRDLWKVTWDGDEVKRLTKGNQRPSRLHWNTDGKSINFLGRGGSIKQASADSGKVSGLPFSTRIRIDPKARQLQVFDEAWRTMGQRFYDPAMHGVDWEAMRAKYRPLAEVAVTYSEFSNIVNRMLGELNSSHLGFRGGGPDGVDESSGELGLVLAPPDGQPGRTVVDVVPDGPAATAAASIQVGERLMAIDDEPLDDDARIYQLLRDRVRDRVRLKVQAQPELRRVHRRGDHGRNVRVAGEEREVIVRPISTGALGNLLYEDWVRANQERVDELSGGRLGYLHVRSMSTPQLERFEQELYSVAHGRDGLLIDVRNNGGGWTTDYMLAMLMVKSHATTVPRGGGPGYPQGRRPLYAWSKPVATLCNQYSFSNAEIFSHSMQTLGRGQVIGMETAGGVISTGGTRLMDGSWLRLPFRGWWSDGTGKNMEGNGAVPDHVVPMNPDDERSGSDPQLETAVRVLLDELGAAAGGSTLR